MKAIRYEKGGRENAALVDAPMPKVGPFDVLVKIYASCICKPADFAHDGGYSAFGTYPLIPGHEWAGIVEEVGESVSRFKKGDRVTADANVPCGKCYFCERGEVKFCINNKAYGQNMDGGFAQFISIDEDLVYRIPDSVSLREASMTELVGCVYNCMERCNFKYGSEVLVLGAGASGNLIAQMAKNSAAATVVAIDSVQSKLDKLSPFGVETLLVDRDHYEKHEEELMKRFPYGFDYIIDGTADAVFITSSLKLLKRGGTFVNYSFINNVQLDKEPVELNTKWMATRQMNYIGSMYQHWKFPQTLHSIAEHKVDPMSIITDIMPLEDFFKGMDKMWNDPDTIKVLLEPNGSSEGM